MKRFIQEVILRLLYLTPIGYILSLLSLISGEKTPGVYVVLERNSPLVAYIKQNPLLGDRVGWLINGIFLLLQVFVVASQKVGDIVMAYGWMALLFGTVSILSAFFPNFGWNKRLNIIKISILEIVVLITLGISVALS